MSRFVTGTTRTLTLANGDQLIVREQLTAGEQRAHFARIYYYGPDGDLRRDLTRLKMGIVLAYLLDWNLRDDADQAVRIRDLNSADLEQVLDALDIYSFDEIHQAIVAHEAAMLRAREEKKTTPIGELVS
jgi:hypothetical protein